MIRTSDFVRYRHDIIKYAFKTRVFRYGSKSNVKCICFTFYFKYIPSRFILETS